MAATFTVETGTGSTTANAYCTVAYADQYHEDYGNPTSWSSAATADKEEAIRLGTRYLDFTYSSRWRGTRKSRDQALDWPRRSAVDPSGWLRLNDSVPLEIQQATAIMALKSIDGDTFLADIEATSQGITEEAVEVGPIKERFKYASTKPNFKSYSIVLAVLRPLLIIANSRIRS